MSNSTLDGKRVLVVEDEPVIAMMLEEMLAEAGWIVAGTARDNAGAAALVASNSPDCVLLDTHLADGDSYALAVALRDQQVPLVLSSGDRFIDLPPSCAGLPFIGKPFTWEDLEMELGRALRTSGRRAGASR